MNSSKDHPQPFWASALMHGESLLFCAEAATDSARAPLLFSPLEVCAVTAPASGVTYQEGRDWRLEGSELVRPQGSAMPLRTLKELTPPQGSQPYDLRRRDGSGEILFGAGHEYHDAQVEVTYRHQPGLWRGPQLAFSGAHLPRFMRALSERRRVTVTVFGDSISTGCNASGWAQVAPFQPGYPAMLCAALERAYGTTVELRNCSVSGQTSGWGVGQVSSVADTKPDLVILAWGMNDGNAPGVPAAEFAQNIQAQITTLRAAEPNTEFVLVAGMLPNDDVLSVVPGLLLRYRDALAELAGPGVVLADVSGVWTELLKRKRHLDLTGNGVNHPNDFGHRVYAQVLGAVLIP